MDYTHSLAFVSFGGRLCPFPVNRLSLPRIVMSFYRRIARLAMVSIAVAIAPWLAAPSVAQQVESRIVGIVADAGGGLLPGATVTVTSQQTGATRITVSDESGRFTLTNLGPGTYDVTVELSGFAASKTTVALGVGENKPIDVKLGLANVTESVTVQA